MIKPLSGRLKIPAMGICYHHYYAPNSTQRDQLKQIRDLGFDVINTEESPIEPATPPGPLPAITAWNHIEIGKNKYDWSFHDHLVEDCEAVGLKLITDIFVYCHLPTWVVEKYGDTDVVAPNGRRWGHFKRPLCGHTYEMQVYSLAHEGAAAAAADFLGKIAARYKGSSAVVGHNLFQELGLNYPHATTWYGQDVSPAAVKGFEKYLQRKYSSLDYLNRDWRRKYANFADAATDPALFKWDRLPHRGWQLWCDWRLEYTTRFIRGMHDAVKAADPEALTTVSAATPSVQYSIVQGVDIERLGFVDMVAEKSFGPVGFQDHFRGVYVSQRLSGTHVALSNINSYEDDNTPAFYFGRAIMASIGMGSKWNSLYAWGWLSSLDNEKGVRVERQNLLEFATWIKFLDEKREMFSDAMPPPAKVAVFRPGRSDLTEFWHENDTRTSNCSHPLCTDFTMNTYKMCSLLDSWSIHYDFLSDRTLPERLSEYNLLILGEPCLSEEMVVEIKSFLAKGGKLILLMSAGRFNDYGETVNWFGEKIPQQMEALRTYQEYIGWEKDAEFPFDASIVLLPRINGMQMPDIMKWVGFEPVLTFIDPPPPPPAGPFGSCREAEVVSQFFWRDHVSSYRLDSPEGQKIYVIVRKGKGTDPLKHLTVAWDGGPVTLYLPPDARPKILKPSKGGLVVPPFSDVAIIVA